MFKFLGSAMCIDLGSSYVRISNSEQGAIWQERSVIALYQNSQGERSVLATGKDAMEMSERVPKNIEMKEK